MSNRLLPVSEPVLEPVAVSVLILTLNEERNLGACMASPAWLR